MHLGLPLRDYVALDQPIEDSKAEVKRVLHLLGPGCRLVALLEDDEFIDQAALYKEPKQVAPPLLARSTHKVVGPMLVMEIDAPHVLIVGQNRLWNGLQLSLTCRKTNTSFVVSFIF